jgi:hypothetical protein
MWRDRRDLGFSQEEFADLRIEVRTDALNQAVEAETADTRAGRLDDHPYGAAPGGWLRTRIGWLLGRRTHGWRSRRLRLAVESIKIAILTQSDQLDKGMRVEYNFYPHVYSSTNAIVIRWLSF